MLALTARRSLLEPTPHDVLCVTHVQAATNLLGVLVPLLKLLTSEQIRLDLPVLATMHDSLSLSALSTALQALSTAAAGDETYFRSNMHGSMVRTASDVEQGWVACIVHELGCLRTFTAVFVSTGVFTVIAVRSHFATIMINS